MTKYIENYLKNYGDQLVSEKSLKYLLPLLYPDVIKEVSVKKIASFYDNIKLFDETIKNKRFDFISISKKLIIEFNGPQHFKHIEYFGSYEKFINQRKIDLDKQKFIKENNFHLIRITGKLTLNEFYNLVKDLNFNLDENYAIFIENNKINKLRTNELKDSNDEISMLALTVENLQNQIKLLNNSAQNKPLKSRNKDYGYEYVHQFLTWELEQELLVGKFTMNIFYNEYLYWNKTENGNINPLKIREFITRLKPLLDEFGLTLGSTDDRIRLSSLSLLDVNVNVLNEYFFDNTLNDNKYNMSIYVECADQITKSDLAKFKERMNNFEEFYSYKDLMMLEYFISKMDDDAMVYKEYLKTLNENK